MQIGNYIIRTSKSLRKILEDKVSEKQFESNTVHFLLGVYSSRLFGLCIYRIQEKNIEFEKHLIECNKKNKTITVDKNYRMTTI